MTKIEVDLIELVATESGARKEDVALKSTLLGDLGLDGDDAWEVFEALQSKFGVDISSFEFERHFRSEPCFKGILYFLRKLKSRDEHVAARKEPVTVAQLVGACEKKAWKYDV
jgi:acyl carrier protein